jgi:hypothetical protein
VDLISNKIRQVKYARYGKTEFFYIRIERGSKAYRTYTDCRDKINPIGNEENLEKLFLKLKDFLQEQMEANEEQPKDKKDLAIFQLGVIFENIIETISL